MEKNTVKKRKTQPLGLPSGGCFFKKNSITSLHKFYIQHNVLGFRVGEAMVSTKNANFLVNMNNATSSHVFHLQAFNGKYFIKNIIKNYNVKLF